MSSIRDAVEEKLGFIQIEPDKVLLEFFHGSKFSDLGNKSKWQIYLKSIHIFVMIGQVFLNVLRRGIISLDDVK